MNRREAAEESTLVDNIVRHIMEKKGENIIILDLRKVSSVADYFILVTGNSSVQIKAIADEISEKLKKEDKISPWHKEGYDSLSWVLLDYVDVVVHIFNPETRMYFSLEKLWEDAPAKKISTDY